MDSITLPLIAVPALPAIDSISAIEAARAQRDELLTKARKGTSITSPEAAAKCGAFLKQLAEFTRTIEETRKAVKAPVLEVGKRIDAVADELTRDVESEYKRINGLLGAFTSEQKRKEEEARRHAWEEQQRIAREAKELEERIAREREQSRAKVRSTRLSELAKVDCHPTHLGDVADLTDEQFAKVLNNAIAAKQERDRLEQQAARARSAKQKEEAERKAREARDAEERRQKEQAELAEKQRLEREQRERDEAAKRAQDAAAAQAKAATAVIPSAPKLEGISNRMDVEFEVTDIVALYEAQPAFVVLTPNKAALKAALKQLPEGQSLPGVRHWKTAKAIVR